MAFIIIQHARCMLDCPPEPCRSNNRHGRSIIPDLQLYSARKAFHEHMGVHHRSILKSSAPAFVFVIIWPRHHPRNDERHDRSKRLTLPLVDKLVWNFNVKVSAVGCELFESTSPESTCISTRSRVPLAVKSFPSYVVEASVYFARRITGSSI